MVAAFVGAGATDPTRARAPEELALANRLHALQQLRDRDVIRMAAPGRYWVDVQAWDDFMRRRRQLALVLAIGAALAGMAAAALTQLR